MPYTLIPDLPAGAEVPENGEVWRQLSSIYTRQDRIRLAKAADARAKELGH